MKRQRQSDRATGGVKQYRGLAASGLSLSPDYVTLAGMATERRQPRRATARGQHEPLRRGVRTTGRCQRPEVSLGADRAVGIKAGSSLAKPLGVKGWRSKIAGTGSAGGKSGKQGHENRDTHSLFAPTSEIERFQGNGHTPRRVRPSRKECVSRLLSGLSGAGFLVECARKSASMTYDWTCKQMPSMCDP